MELFKFYLLCFFFPLTMAFAVYAQTAQVEQSFLFSDEFNNTQELIIGYDPFGSDGLDPGLGEVVIPQVPPNQFGVRLQIPRDTSIYTIKDIRFGCGQPFYYEHLFDLNYATGSSSLDVDWEWSFELWIVHIIDPNTGLTLVTLESFFDSSYYIIPAMVEKIIFGIQYNGPLSWPEYEVNSPNGGETLEGGNIYDITWWSNQLAPWLDIEFSSDSGATWNLIADSMGTTDSSYSWQVPKILSENCLIRLGNYPCRYDLSDSVFTIDYSVSIETGNGLPSEFSLEQNYPNPFNPKTKIKFTIPTSPLNPSPYQGEGQRERLISLKVYDVLGNETATLVNEEKPAGSYEVEFDATELTSGIYFYRLVAGSYIETRKMVLLK